MEYIMINMLQSKWNEILSTLKREHEISDVSFNLWLLPLKIHSVEDDLITILVPEENLGLNYIKKKYYAPLRVTIEEVTGHAFELEFILPHQVKENTHSVSSKKEDSYLQSRLMEANLNSKYTFDSFVVGSNNNFAYAASLAVAESPGEVYNPLFLYGGAGLGKTHLMQSIARFVIEHNPDAKVLYVTSEAFTNELINVIRNENQTAITEFRNKYRNIDILLIDDIQFIIGKDRSQEEFFHTFNTLYGAKKQVIISSDKAPKNFETLDERYRSRFEMGLTVDISPPDYETRMAILRKKSELEGYSIDDKVFQYIATNIKSNIRELEGAITKVVAFSKLSTNKQVDVDFAAEVLKDIISPDENVEVTPSSIIKIVSDHFNLTPEDLASKKKSQNIAYPRQLAMYLCRELTETSFEMIGNILGNRDHSTVMYAYDKIASELQTNDSTKNVIEVLTKKINPS